MNPRTSSRVAIERVAFLAPVTSEPPAAESAVGAATARASGVAASFDRWVLEGIVDAVAGLTRAAAWMTGALDDQVVDRPIRILTNCALRIARDLRARISRASTKSPG